LEFLIVCGSVRIGFCRCPGCENLVIGGIVRAFLDFEHYGIFGEDGHAVPDIGLDVDGCQAFRSIETVSFNDDALGIEDNKTEDSAKDADRFGCVGKGMQVRLEDRAGLQKVEHALDFRVLIAVDRQNDSAARALTRACEALL
jgi:hypothetical protein